MNQNIHGNNFVELKTLKVHMYSYNLRLTVMALDCKPGVLLFTEQERYHSNEPGVPSSTCSQRFLPAGFIGFVDGEPVLRSTEMNQDEIDRMIPDDEFYPAFKKDDSHE